MGEKNYCLVILGDTLGVKIEIERICSSDPNILDAKGILIATFKSLLGAEDIRIFLKENNRSFLFFELDEKHSGFHITKDSVHQGLFGFLGKLNQELNDSVNADKQPSLEELLKNAIDTENYEKAAKIRDLMNKNGNKST
jgi:hypothetical protein